MDYYSKWSLCRWYCVRPGFFSIRWRRLDYCVPRQLCAMCANELSLNLVCTCLLCFFCPHTVLPESLSRKNKSSNNLIMTPKIMDLNNKINWNLLFAVRRFLLNESTSGLCAYEVRWFNSDNAWNSVADL